MPKKKKTLRNKVFVKKKTKNDSVATPSVLYKLLDEEFKFDYDPCPLNPDFDGLKTEWKQSNYINPPYSKIKPWIVKTVEEFKKDKKCVVLIPLRPNLNYWFQYIYPNCTEIRFIQNFKFQGYKNVCPFPCCILIFDPAKKNKNTFFVKEDEIKQVILS